MTRQQRRAAERSARKVAERLAKADRNSEWPSFMPISRSEFHRLRNMRDDEVEMTFFDVTDPFFTEKTELAFSVPTDAEDLRRIHAATSIEDLDAIRRTLS